MILKNSEQEKIELKFNKRVLKGETVNIQNIEDNSIAQLSFNKELLKNLKKTTSNLEGHVEILNRDNIVKNNNFIPTLKRTQAIGYRNIKLLKSYLTEYKKIKSRRLTKLTLKQQRQLSKSVKRARMLKLFDLRKTLKPRKFLNFEKKVETLQTLIVIKLLNLEALLNLIKTNDTFNMNRILLFIDLFKYLNKKNYIN